MIILEGTDAVGKSSVITNLKDYNLQDRDKFISKLFMFDISLLDRVNRLFQYLKTNNNQVIFLVNNDKEELDRRIRLRTHLSEFDEYAYEYNQLYLDTFNYMKDHNLLMNKLFLVDTTNLSIKEQVNKVKEIILCQDITCI